MSIDQDLGSSTGTKVRDVYVLRRNVCISEPRLRDRKTLIFGNNNIIIPTVTIDAVKEYLDKKGAKGYKIQIGTYFLDFIFNISPAVFSKDGYQRENGSTIRIVAAGEEFDPRIQRNQTLSNYDKATLQVCLDQMKILESKGEGAKVFLITSNLSLIKTAYDLGIDAKPYEDPYAKPISKQFTGVLTDLTAPQGVIETLNKQKIPVEYTEITDYEHHCWDYNMFVKIRSTSKEKTALGRYSNGMIYPLMYGYDKVMNVCPRSDEQRFLIEALSLPPEVSQLTIAKGYAGVGKTYITLATVIPQLNRNEIYTDQELDGINAAAAKSLAGETEEGKSSKRRNSRPKRDGEKEEYQGPPKIVIGSENGLFDQIVIASPKVTLDDEDYGALPGDIILKASPYLGGIIDNIVNILKEMYPRMKRFEIEGFVYQLFERKIIRVDPISYMRGRDFKRTCVIIDEAQNVDPDIIPDITTRFDEGSRLILLGDHTQVKKRGLNPRYNGIVYTAESFKDFINCYVVTFTRKDSERNDMTKFAVKKFAQD